MLAGILSAPEFYEDAGNTGSAWVDTLYRNLFYRAATTEEESKTLQKLAAQ